MHLVHHKAAIDDINTARDTNLAAVRRRSFAGIGTAFDPDTGKAPWYKIDLLFQERVEVGIGRGHQRSAVARRGPQDFNFGDLVVIYAQTGTDHVRRFLVGDDYLGKRLAGVLIKQAEMMVYFQRRIDQTFFYIGKLVVLTSVPRELRSAA